jgi:hypothetical protein
MAMDAQVFFVCLFVCLFVFAFVHNIFLPDDDNPIMMMMMMMVMRWWRRWEEEEEDDDDVDARALSFLSRLIFSSASGFGTTSLDIEFVWSWQHGLSDLARLGAIHFIATPGHGSISRYVQVEVVVEEEEEEEEVVLLEKTEGSCWSEVVGTSFCIPHTQTWSHSVEPKALITWVGAVMSVVTKVLLILPYNIIMVVVAAAADCWSLCHVHRCFSFVFHLWLLSVVFVFVFVVFVCAWVHAQGSKNHFIHFTSPQR